jgi:hypothetical protein
VGFFFGKAHAQINKKCWYISIFGFYSDALTFTVHWWIQTDINITTAGGQAGQTQALLLYKLVCKKITIPVFLNKHYGKNITIQKLLNKHIVLTNIKFVIHNVLTNIMLVHTKILKHITVHTLCINITLQTLLYKYYCTIITVQLLL